jgi:putative transposase
MGRHRRPEEVRRLLREADRDLAKGLTVGDICQKLGIRTAVYYRWRQRSDSARTDDSPRIRELQAEVERLKRLVADLMLDKQMLEEVAKKKW